MTRGTFYAILPKGMVIASDELNGDMYGSPKDEKSLQDSGHYNEAVKCLMEVEDEKDFRWFVSQFNENHHNYDDFSFRKFKIDEYLNKDGMIDMDEKTYFERFFSDYLFFVNVSEKPVYFVYDWSKEKYQEKGQERLDKEIVRIEFGEIATFNFGKPIEAIKGHFCKNKK